MIYGKMNKTYKTYMIKDDSKTKNNVYIVIDEKTRKTAVVDPACTIDKIEEFLNTNKVSLDAVLITHTHEDHVRCVNEIVKRYSCNVYVSRIEKEYYQYECERMCTLEDGQIFYLGETTIKCLLTPGHTHGSICFLLQDDLFSGDTIFMEGCGWCNYDGGSADQMYDSIAKIKEMVRDDVAVHPGHTYVVQPGKTMEYLKQNNIYVALDERKMFVEFRNRKGQTDLECFT